MTRSPIRSGHRHQRRSELSRPAGWALSSLPPGPPAVADEQRRPLVGREKESGALAGAVAALLDGTGRIVEVTGEPGIGKSRLLDQVAAVAREHGVQVLAGRAPVPGSDVPMAAIVDALDPYLPQVSPARLAELRSDHAQLLNDTFPSLRLPGARSLAPAGVPAGARQLRAVRLLLETLAAERPLLITIDDLHNGDRATIDLVCHLLDAPLRTPLLLVVAHRRRQSPARLRLALDTAGQVTRIEVTPLERAHLDELTELPLSAGQRAVLHELSEGNPQYLSALLAGALPHGPASEHVELGALPAEVEAALAAELELLSRAAHLVASAAAVLGPEPVDTGLLAEVAGIATEHVPAAIDELVAADLLRPVTGSGCFAFRHPVVQHAAYLTTDAGWRLTAHARALAELRRRRSSTAAQAPHLLRLAVPGDMVAVEVLSEAATAVLDRAPHTAVRWLGAAIRLSPSSANPSESRVMLTVRLGQALAAAGHPRAARAVLHDALRLLDKRPSAYRTTATLLCAQVERQLGRHGAAAALLRTGLTRPDEAQPADRAALALALGAVEMTSGRAGQARRWAAAALGAARRATTIPGAVRAHALGLLAAASHLRGNRAAGGETNQAALQLNTTLDAELGDEPESALWVGWSEILLDRSDAAVHHLTRAIDVSPGARSYFSLLHLLCTRSLAHRCAGRLAEASADCAEVLRLASGTQFRELHVAAEAMGRLLTVWSGTEEVEPTVVPYTLDLPASGWPGRLVLSANAETLLALGDTAGCLAVAATAGLPELEPWAQVGWYELLTRATLAEGDPDAATEWAQRAYQVAERLGRPGRSALAASARARVLALRDPAAAAEAAAAAAETLTRVRMPLDAAQAHIVAARALVADGDPDRAVATLRLAEEIFDRCGAGLFTRQVNTERRRLLAGRSGGARRPRRQGGSPTLTRRETQVAALVSEGLTNRQVAARLFVTQKTVEMHLSHVYAKMGVTNRAALVRRFHLGGLASAQSS
ncbi:helix-turn-helix transcriptional regulator [Micromonospora andamanensis]|uniref:helix-turn-helix transcriptional regulator n=1 Tax=Micromonospora andamanensis TaxID=1287068 RepID=UPI001952412C|nr:AAA family ATPase [Micromonospora andamanensis]